MSIKEHLLEIEARGIDPQVIIRQRIFSPKLREEESLRMQQIRQGQGFLLEQLKSFGVIASIEEFTGEEIPLLEEYDHRLITRLMRFPDSGNFTRMLLEEDITDWRVYIPQPRKLRSGRWDKSLELALFNIPNPKDGKEIILNYDGEYLAIVSGDVTFEHQITKPLDLSQKSAIERNIAEAIWTPLSASFAL